MYTTRSVPDRAQVCTASRAAWINYAAGYGVCSSQTYDTAQILERNTLSADRKFTKWAQQGRPSISHTTLPCGLWV